MLLIDIRHVEGFWILIISAGHWQSGSIWLVDLKVGVYDPNLPYWSCKCNPEMIPHILS